ncbi:MAG TPA: efflux RND transporter periplasmic adaptor subunit [Candidatus Hydrogenedentes bacterium]|nr:efflux RND transporter periplasmic adaptor subunit [Candidatus Hydrogenedentota bacterium]
MSSSPKSENPSAPVQRRSKRRLWWKLGVVAVAIAVGVWYFREPAQVVDKASVWSVKRGPLPITVVETGSVVALESQDIKSEVKGETKVLSIVEEGYQVTEDDVKNKKVLVTLDSAELVTNLTQQEIQYQSASAAYTEAKEQYGIQIKDNESNIKEAQLSAKFARMDFEKYLGVELANKIITELGLNTNLDSAEEDLREIMEAVAAGQAEAEDTLNGDAEEAPSETSNAVPAPALASGDGDAAPASNAIPASPISVSGEPQPPAASPSGLTPEQVANMVGATQRHIDFSQYADPKLLGDGEAQQKLRKFETDAMMSDEELNLSKTQLEGTQRLFEGKFVTQTELDNDTMKVKRGEIASESAKTEKDLFIKYEFRKQAEKLLSDYEESLRKLDRTRKLAISKMAQAQAKLKSSEAQFGLQRQRRDDLQKQVRKCTIVAERPGLVVYAGNDQPWRGGEEIKEGAKVYQGQSIITIPDMTQMAIEIKVHESAIKKVAKGQKAAIRIDAFPDTPLTGVVHRVGVLPDSSQRWMNPDVKLYLVKVTIDGTHDWLKPGMSGEVTVKIAELDDVVYVPIQAVTPTGEERAVNVVSALGTTERRVVKVGDFNNQFIQIKEGLKDGERVLLRAPMEEEGKSRKDLDAKDAKETKGGDTERKTENARTKTREAGDGENGATKDKPSPPAETSKKGE